MFCESYRQPLIDAAASGGALPREVAAHLAGCDACSSGFAAEQALFSSIDCSLHAASNAEIPASLIPGVREALARNAFPFGGFQWRTVLVFGSTVLIVGMLALWHTRAVSRNEKIPAAVESLRTSVTGPEKQIEFPTKISPGAVRRVSRRPQVRPVAMRSNLEVIISPEEEVALGKYVAMVNTKNANGLASNTAKWDLRASFEPLEISAIDLRELAIRPLRDGDAD